MVFQKFSIKAIQTPNVSLAQFRIVLFKIAFPVNIQMFVKNAQLVMWFRIKIALKVSSRTASKPKMN